MREKNTFFECCWIVSLILKCSERFTFFFWAGTALQSKNVGPLLLCCHVKKKKKKSIFHFNNFLAFYLTIIDVLWLLITLFNVLFIVEGDRSEGIFRLEMIVFKALEVTSMKVLDAADKLETSGKPVGFDGMCHQLLQPPPRDSVNSEFAPCSWPSPSVCFSVVSCWDSRQRHWWVSPCTSLRFLGQICHRKITMRQIPRCYFHSHVGQHFGVCMWRQSNTNLYQHFVLHWLCPSEIVVLWWRLFHPRRTRVKCSATGNYCCR